MLISIKETRRSANSNTRYFYVTADNEKAVARAVKRVAKAGNIEKVYNYKENFALNAAGVPEYANTTLTLKVR
jgi:hypothetical protein